MLARDVTVPIVIFYLFDYHEFQLFFCGNTALVCSDNTLNTKITVNITTSHDATGLEPVFAIH